MCATTEVAEGEEGVHVLDHLDLAVEGGLGEVEFVVSQDLHFQGQRPLGDRFADAAKADDAQGFAGELCAHKGLAVPLAGAEGCVGGGDFA